MFDLNDIANAPFSACPDETRLEALNRQLAYAAANSPYYRDALVGCFPLDSLAGLARLPFTDADTLRREGTRLVCVPGAQVERIVSLRSSGTTGQAKRLYFTRGDLERTVDFFAQGMAWMCAPGDVVAVLMPCDAPDGIGDLLCRALERIGTRPLPMGLPRDFDAVCAAVQQMQPAVLVGFPWHLRLLALRCPALRPRAVLLSADYTPVPLPGFLAELWHTRVLEHFGMTETGYGCAVEHPCATGMFLRRDELVAEVVDPDSGTVLAPGQVGELVLTTLRREAMPLLRYRTGDLARLTPSGELARVSGRIAADPETYRVQDALCTLPWLWDYGADETGLTAAVSPDAPPDAQRSLTEAAGREVTVQTVPAERARLFALGKRI